MNQYFDKYNMNMRPANAEDIITILKANSLPKTLSTNQMEVI